MPDHVRKQIRAAAATALTGLTTTGANVFPSRVYPMQDADLPGLRIYTNDEQIENEELGAGRTRERSLDLVVEACVKAATGYDDTADQIQKEVEIALDGDNTLGGLAKYIEPRQVQNALAGEGEKPIALRRIVFEVFYQTAMGAPDVAL